MGKHKDTQSLGLRGTYAVLMRLTELGWTAIITPGNSKNTDIIAYKEKGHKTICKRIEVKTTSNGFHWPQRESRSPYGKQKRPGLPQQFQCSQTRISFQEQKRH